tara:strand:- start:369 stop:563 length:195 start_codon:yes stop_codon:yes gene_type:complete
MKVGDLVKMKRELVSTYDVNLQVVGIIIECRTKGKSKGFSILWPTNKLARFIPRAWLEVVNESR